MVSLDRQLGHLAGRAEHRDVTRTGGDAGRPAVDPPNQRGGGESDSGGMSHTGVVMPPRIAAVAKSRRALEGLITTAQTLSNAD